MTLEDATSTRILVLGDTHGNLHHLQEACSAAVLNDCDRILQLGDWGYLWPGADKLDEATAILEEHGLHMYFLDGNHDNHELLSHDSTEMVQLSEAVTYLPRGHVWEWGGKKLMALGGAVSVDKNRRTTFISWWPSETISHADTERAISNGEGEDIYIMFTHDAPAGVSVLEEYLKETAYMYGAKLEGESAAHRRTMREIVERVQPRFLFHGHYHHRYEDTLTFKNRNFTRVVGLGRDGQAHSWFVVSL